MYTAQLGCGSVLSYEARSFVPPTGERVPCRSHGYCVVIRRGRTTRPASSRLAVTRARPRERHELLEWLEGCPVASVATLLRQRFTLRLISAAARDGLVRIDTANETVTLAGR